MELKNQKDTYLTLLESTLHKKSEVLDQLLNLTYEQEAMINKPSFDEVLFGELIDKKDEQIKMINQLDDGFEQLYQRIKEELTFNRSSYKNQIIRLQELIKIITDKGVQLQVLEKRNKSKLEMYLQAKRKEIKSFHINSKIVSSYYKNISGAEQQESYFFDKKK